MINGNPPVDGGLDDDDALLAMLGRALRDDSGSPDVGEPPADAVELAKAAWNDSELDAELAALLFDSVLDVPAGLMRADNSTSTRRSLTFEGSSARIEIDLDGDELVGQLEPSGAATVDLHTARGVSTTRSDGLGRFRFDIPRGRLRLHVRLSSGVALLTPWVSR